MRGPKSSLRAPKCLTGFPVGGHAPGPGLGRSRGRRAPIAVLLVVLGRERAQHRRLGRVQAVALPDDASVRRTGVPVTTGRRESSHRRHDGLAAALARVAALLLFAAVGR